MTLILSLLLLSIAQDSDVNELRRQVIELTARNRHLEKENSMLKAKVVLNYYVAKVEGGGALAVVAGNDREKVGLNIYTSAGGWGEADPNNAAMVCARAASHALAIIQPEKPLMVYVVNDENAPSPECKGTIGPDGEFFVVVKIDGDRRDWAKLAYQFSHEFGHVLIGDANRDAPQMWFEEAFAEAMSLWTMTKMGEAWKAAPPYPNWADYAPALTSYISEVRDRDQQPVDVPKWYREHAEHLTQTATDRPMNLVVAKILEKEIHRNPSFLRSIYFLRRNQGENPEKNTMQWLLNDWKNSVPDDLKSGPEFVARQLGIR